MKLCFWYLFISLKHNYPQKMSMPRRNVPSVDASPECVQLWTRRLAEQHGI